MVDRSVPSSLESLAADRGVTIGFAELDGADGLWLPEERTILVSSRLSGRRVDEVIEHELSHVDIEDGHAALDAAVTRWPTARMRWGVALTAVASIGLLVTIRLQLPARQTAELTRPPESPGVTASVPPGRTSPAQTGQPGVQTKIVTRVVDGEVRVETITVPPSVPSNPSVSPTAVADGSASPTLAGPASPTAAPSGPVSSPATTPAPSITPDPSVTATDPSPTPPAGTSGGTAGVAH